MRKQIEENDTQILVLCDYLEWYGRDSVLKYGCKSCDFKKANLKDGAKELHCYGPEKMKEEMAKVRAKQGRMII